jgi:hypothetical protein
MQIVSFIQLFEWEFRGIICQKSLILFGGLGVDLKHCSLLLYMDYSSIPATVSNPILMFFILRYQQDQCLPVASQ